MRPPLLDYANIHRQTTALTPVVFVLSPGADPAYDLFRLGEQLGFKPGVKLKYMALGQVRWHWNYLTLATCVFAIWDLHVCAACYA